MLKKILYFSFLTAATLAVSSYISTNPKMLEYPKTRKINVTDNCFGTTVEDPYRWLEDDTASDTKEWVKQENAVTFNYLSQISYREKIRQRLTLLWNYEKYGLPFKEGNETYFFKNDGLQNQSVLYRQKGDSTSEVFLDPNTFSADGTTSLSDIEFTEDGSLAAYQLSEGGSDWRTVKVIQASDKKETGDVLTQVKFSGIAWKGNEGFYYSSYDRPENGSQLSGMTQYHKLYYHKLGTPQSDDKLIFGGAETPRRYIGAYVTEDQRFLSVTAANSTTGNELYIQDLKDPNGKLIQVVSGFENEYQVIGSEGKKIWVYTNAGAPNYKLVTIDADELGKGKWNELIPQTEHVLQVSTSGGKIFANYLKDATSYVVRYDLEGKKEKEIKLPGIGTASGFSGKRNDTEVYYSFTSYVDPSSIYKYDIRTGASSLYKRSKVAFDPGKYESKQVFYKSKDGTRIPMILTYKKGLKLDGKNPTLLYGYGGFSVSLTPAFSTSNIVLLEQGGIFAVPNIRGGGEYGEKWHLAGTKLKKQNVFDDFIAAAEYLITNKYTSSDYLAISGGSNGGLLVGACMTQRPELFKVAFPAVGVLDMLRYNKFTAGAGWAYDYGTAEDSKETFEYLYKYSPYHALKKGTRYPATLITTADHDDRVVPAHSFKFAARLQEYHTGDSPVLIRIETKAGHGAGKSTAQIIAEQTDKWAFMFGNMGVKISD